ncbi:MAG: trypsin-like peptidase domain-containing protein [Ruminococcus sp.]|jgi:serine protease Do|nr:trypsin-like peptidase domain-containing protein [Ruminococcus sp.]
MENNNNFENGFYGSAPQKPFTDKSSDVPANPQTFSASKDESVNNSEPTAAEMLNEQPVQDTNPVSEQIQEMNYGAEPFIAENQTAPVQSAPAVQNAQQETYQQNPDFTPQRPDYGNAPHNDYSHPQYSGSVNYPQNGMPVQNNYGNPNVNYGGYNPQAQYNPNPQNQYNPNFQNNQNVPPQYNTYAPYPPMPPKSPKKKVNTGLVVIIVVLCVLLFGSLAGLFVYVTSNNSSQNNNSANSFDFTMPNYGYNVPSTEPTTEPASEHKESDYSDRVDENYKGLALESKPKDADTNKEYTAEYAFNKVSDSVVGIVGYTDEITTVEKSATQGSGIIITSDGYVVTNAHVIGNSKTKYLLQVVTSDGKTYNAGVVGYDSRTDIAVLKMDDAKDLKAATFGDSEKIELGEDIIAVGNPGGLDYQNSITKGIVSAVDRKLSSTSLVKYIQTDAAINPGNSGGPIVNLYGQVIGIATSKIVSEKYEGMGFAIPSATAKDIVDTLMKKGYVEGRVKIGITGSNISSTAASTYGIPMGILVDEISKGGPCDGTELKKDDIITGIDDETIESFSDIYEILETHKPGDKIVIKYYRMSDDSTGEVEVTLAEDK